LNIKINKTIFILDDKITIKTMFYLLINTYLYIPKNN